MQLGIFQLLSFVGQCISQHLCQTTLATLPLPFVCSLSQCPPWQAITASPSAFLAYLHVLTALASGDKGARSMFLQVGLYTAALGMHWGRIRCVLTHIGLPGCTLTHHTSRTHTQPLPHTAAGRRPLCHGQLAPHVPAAGHRCAPVHAG